MANQPVPNVTDDDVKRIALRDFGAARVELAMSIVEEFGKQSWNQPSARVRLAILKLANGNLDWLLDATKTAIDDYRDVLAPAEYPRYFREISSADAPEHLKQTAIEADWKQYQDWLRRE